MRFYFDSVLACMGMLVLLSSVLGVSKDLSAKSGAMCCVGLYSFLIMQNARRQYAGYQRNYLGGSCPFSLRNRILGERYCTLEFPAPSRPLSLH